MSEPAIVTHDLQKIYPAARAVDGLNLNVPAGAVYGFLGRNGAGKTTTMRLLLGLARLSAGSGRVLGLDIRRDRLAILQRTAFVGERKMLYESLTAKQLVRFTASFYASWSHQAAEKYARLLEIPMTQRLSKLSHGNRTKVCLLLALAQGADLLVLDEPKSALDPIMIDQALRTLLEDHTAEGRTIFFASHHLAEVEQIADWVGIIDQGKLLLEARLEDIKNEFRLIIAAGNNLPASTSSQIISAVPSDRFRRYVVAREAEAFAAELRSQGAEIVEISPLTLREIFLALLKKEEPCTPGNTGVTPALVS